MEPREIARSTLILSEPIRTSLKPRFLALLRQINDCTRICSMAEWTEMQAHLSWGSHGSTTCCICLTDISPEARVRGLACGHVFHLDCVGQWFLQDKTFELPCPVCRRPMDKQNTLPESPNLQFGDADDDWTSSQGNYTVPADEQCNVTAVRPPTPSSGLTLKHNSGLADFQSCIVIFICTLLSLLKQH